MLPVRASSSYLLRTSSSTSISSCRPHTQNSRTARSAALNSLQHTRRTVNRFYTLLFGRKIERQQRRSNWICLSLRTRVSLQVSVQLRNRQSARLPNGCKRIQMMQMDLMNQFVLFWLQKFWIVNPDQVKRSPMNSAIERPNLLVNAQ